MAQGRNRPLKSSRRKNWSHKCAAAVFDLRRYYPVQMSALHKEVHIMHRVLREG